MTFAPLTPNELYKFISEISTSTAYTKIEDAAREPIFKIAYNQILSFSKEELESITVRFQKEDTLYKLLLNDRPSVFLFGALLDKRVSSHLYSEYTNWILENVKEYTLNTYDLLYTLEFNNFYKDSKEDFFKNHYRRQDPILAITRYYPFDKELVNKFLDNIFQKESNCKIVINEILDELIYDYQSEEDNEMFKNVLLKLEEHNFDITKVNIKDKFKYLNQTGNSVLSNSSKNAEKIEKIINFGFRFDEESFNKNGYSLLQNILDSNSAKIIKAVMPTLTIFENLSDKEVESFRKSVDKIIVQEEDRIEIKSLFEYMVLNNKLSNDALQVKKIKI